MLEKRAGVPRSVAMKLTGHKTESVYRRYAIVSESDLSEAVDRLERGEPTATTTATGTREQQKAEVAVLRQTA